MGGNLCNASPAADTAPAALVLGANLVLHGRRGERVVPIDEFFLGPGKSALKPGEFLLRIEIPPQPKGAVGRYLKLGRNAHGDLAIVGVAVLGYPDKHAKSGYRFPHRARVRRAACRFACRKRKRFCPRRRSRRTSIERATTAAMETAKPISDVRSSAEYRQAMVKVADEAGGEGSVERGCE